jgi:serine/threonine-protein kinase RIO1
MPIEDFMISVFVWVDDTLKALFGVPQAGRTRGPAPRLEDSEVLTMEWVGEFLGYDQDKGIYWDLFLLRRKGNQDV